MKMNGSWRKLLVALGVALALGLGAANAAAAGVTGDYVEQFDTIYNSLTVERTGTLVELRARSKRGVFLESAVDQADPMKLVVPYTRSLYAGLLFEPAPKRVLMIGLGGAGFHRLFMAAFPDTVLHSVEIDPKVTELAQSHLGFHPNQNTPVTALDGRLFVKRNKETWDWIILDAFRGGFVPPHLKTEEFYRECAAKLSERGVFIVNLHGGTKLYDSDLKTLSTVFPQLRVFTPRGSGNRVACAVKYRSPDVTNTPAWRQPAPTVNSRLRNRVDLESVRAEDSDWLTSAVKKAKVLSDDFAPVEFLETIESNNTKDD